jgi:hypothetical protein
MLEQIKASGEIAAGPDFLGTLSRVTAEVLETMFFDQPVPAPWEHGWIPSAALVRLPFEGSHCGLLLLSVSPPMARSIAPAFLGIEPDEVTETQSSQVLLELANILCSSVLSQLWRDCDLRLGPPELIQAEGHIQVERPIQVEAPIQVERPIEDVLHECFVLTEGMLSVSIRVCGTELQ